MDQIDEQATALDNNEVFHMFKKNDQNLPYTEIQFQYDYQIHYTTLNYITKKGGIEVVQEQMKKDYHFMLIILDDSTIEVNYTNPLHYVIAIHLNEEFFQQREIHNFLCTILYQSKFSKAGIYQQIFKHILDIVYLCYKDIILYFARVKGIVNYISLLDLSMKLLMFSQKSQQLTQQDLDQFKPEILENIVYKRLCQQGIFPFYLEINSMDYSKLIVLMLHLFANDNIAPWSAKLHASINIGEFHYSFIPNLFFNITKARNRKNDHLNYQYIRLRFLDFFPLDHWVKQIAGFIDVAIFLNLLKQHVQQINEYQQKETNQSDIKEMNKIDDNQTYVNPIEQQKQKKDMNELVAESKHQFKIFLRKLAHKQVKQRQFVNQFENSFQNKSFLSRDELLMMSKGENYQFEEEKKSNLNTAKKTNDEISMGNRSFIINQVNPELRIIEHIAYEFIQNYKYELIKSEILQRFSSIIAQAEINEYKLCHNNCQTPLANFIYIVKETFVALIEPIPPTPQIIRNIQQLFQQIFDVDHNQQMVVQQNNVNNKLSLDLQINKLPIDSNKLQYSVIEDQYYNIYSQMYKFSSPVEHYLLKMINPISLDKSVEYFCFFSDNATKQLLIDLKNTLKDPQPLLQQYIRSFDKGKIQQEEKCFNEMLNKTEEEACPKLTTFKYIPFLILYYENQLYMQRNKKYRKILEKHKLQNSLQEFLYFYYNSVRLHNSFKCTENFISYLGWLLIKEPETVAKEAPINNCAINKDR